MAKIEIMSLSEYATRLGNASGCEVKNSFTDKTVRVAGERFAVGDTFTIPEEFSVVTMTIGDNEVEYMPIQVKDSKGNKRFANFFPSMLWKFAFEVDEEGNRLNTRPIITSGSVYDAIKNFPTLNDRMEVLRGKTIKVTDAKEIRTLRFRSTETCITTIYTYDFENSRNTNTSKAI